jgi:Zn-dependent peptidase ImmA (M78 family)
MHLPRLIKLPFGYTVRIRHVPYQEFCHLSGDATAYWDSEKKLLYIDSDMPPAEKRYLLMSQLHHILLDANHEYLDSGLIRPTS